MYLLFTPALLSVVVIGFVSLRGHFSNNTDL